MVLESILNPCFEKSKGKGLALKCDRYHGAQKQYSSIILLSRNLIMPIEKERTNQKQRFTFICIWKSLQTTNNKSVNY